MANNLFKIIITLSKKNDMYFDENGLHFLMKNDESDIYGIVNMSKKLVKQISKIKGNVQITIVDFQQRADNIIYWINFYVTFHNLGQNEDKDKIQNFNFIINDQEDKKVESSKIIAAEITYDFELFINKQNSEINPNNFQQQVEYYLEKYKIKYIIESIICDQNSQFRAIYSVGKSGQFLPRLIKINILDDNLNMDEKTCLIGKGITYDTGGYNLKPWRYMLGMNRDKGGAVFALFLGILLKLEFNISSNVLLPVAENKINSLASCPGDIVFNYDNKAIQIQHTDAEGRVVLSDAISYACKHLSFNKMFTFATLTGVAECIIGPDTAIFMSTDTNITNKAIKVSKLVAERVWYLPFQSWCKEFIKFEHNNIQGVKNCTDGSNADTALAGEFLRHFFTSKTASFTHVDLAAMFDKSVTESYSSSNMLLVLLNLISA
jgi:leucyl aminopeptidase